MTEAIHTTTTNIELLSRSLSVLFETHIKDQFEQEVYACSSITPVSHLSLDVNFIFTIMLQLNNIDYSTCKMCTTTCSRIRSALPSLLKSYSADAPRDHVISIHSYLNAFTLILHVRDST